jgi:hypothetical protein
MEAIHLNNALRPHPYASRSIIVKPDPPQVGVATTIAIGLKNPGPGTVVVKRIEVKVARFGMGVPWEELTPIGPFTLPANPDHIEEVTMEWTPTQGGHRCLRAAIYVEPLPQPLRVGRNLEVIESAADRIWWRVPFHLGNPENERVPLLLQLGGSDPDAVDMRVLVNGRPVHPRRPVWLNAKEEVDAEVLLQARTDGAIESVNTVEAILGGQLLDGIEVVVHRPARWSAHTPEKTEQDVMAYEAALAMV